MLMIHDGQNTYENYIALARYGQFLKNDAVYIGGVEAMDNLRTRLAQVVGEHKRDKVFQGITLPVLGTSNTQRPPITQAVFACAVRVFTRNTGKACSVNRSEQR